MTTNETSNTIDTAATDVLETAHVEVNAPHTTSTSEDAAHARRAARADEVAEAAGEIVGAAVDIGRAWARYGLQIGKLALETHARTMGNLAVAVGQAARAVDAVAQSDEPHDQKV